MTNPLEHRNSLQPLFEVWEKSRPMPSEQLLIQLSNDVRQNLRDIRESLSKGGQAESELYTIPEPLKINIVMTESFGKIVPKKDKEPNDWSITITVPEQSLVGPKSRIHLFRLNPLQQTQIKVFNEIDIESYDSSVIRNCLESNNFRPTQVPDLTNLIRITNKIKGLINPQI